MSTLAYFWQMDVRGLVMLVSALLGIVVLQTALAVGVAYGMNKWMSEKLPEKNYGDFDPDSFQEQAFINFIIRMLVVFGATTLVLHLLEYLIVWRDIIRHWGLIRVILFVLETAGICAGLHFVFKLDRLRLAILTAVSAVAYLIFFSFLKRYNLLI